MNNPHMEELPEDESAAGAKPAETGAPAAASEIDALKAEIEKAKDQTLRALADAENTRKRAARERDDATKFAVSNFAKDMLTVADNLCRALEVIPAEVKDNPHMKSVIEGIEATERDLQKSFARYGIRKVDPLGELFNPNFHEVMFETIDSSQPNGSIIKVIEAGYLLHDRLLRPARVGISKDDGRGPRRSIDTQA